MSQTNRNEPFRFDRLEAEVIGILRARGEHTIPDTINHMTAGSNEERRMAVWRLVERGVLVLTMDRTLREKP